MEMKIHSELKDAIENNNLIIFVGSGLSKKFNLPDWNGLVKKVINKEKVFLLT